MKSKANKIYLDFDGVIVNTVKAICKLYNDDFKYYKKFNYINWESIDTWDFTELNCTTPCYINTYFNTERFFNNLEFMLLAEESIKLLQSSGYEIIIVSSGYSPNLIIKEKWVSERFPDIKFIGVNLKENKDKKHIDMSDGIFFDDSETNLITSNAKKSICFGEIHSWNKNWKKDRAYNWYEVLEYIREMEDKNNV